MDIKSLDKLFSPSCWSKRFSTPEQVVNEHLAFVKTESERVRKTIPFETVQYGETFTNETFDIYGIDLPKDAPIFIYIHGGYWQMLDKAVSAYCVKPLVTAGIKVIVLDYDLCPNVTLEQLVDQIQRAGTFFLQYAFQLGTRGIQVAGHSAGAHLAVCLFNYLATNNTITKLSIIKSLYLISGVYDVNELRYTKSVNENNILKINDTNCQQLSPLYFDFTQWTKYNVKIYLFIGNDDTPKLLDHSNRLHQLLQQNKCVSHLHQLDNYDHFHIVEELCRSDFIITKSIINDVFSFN